MMASNLKSFRTVWKLVAVALAIGVASSVMSESVHSDELSVEGKKGKYGCMTDSQKADLFKKFETKNKKKVRTFVTKSSSFLRLLHLQLIPYFFL